MESFNKSAAIVVSPVFNTREQHFRTVWKHVDCRSYVFSFLNEKKLPNLFHCYELNNGKHFIQFLLHFHNMHKVVSIFKKRISFIA